MLPINIYTVTRVRDERLFNIIEKHAADDHDTHRIKVHEIESLCLLADALIAEGITVRDSDGFYFGFTIPQIGKELDLLKVTAKYCLNIELKSQEVPEEQIHTQLIKNRHYLKHLGKRLMLFSVVTDTMTCFRLSQRGNLVKTGIGEIAEAIKNCDDHYDIHIERSFRPSEYLISPVKTPDKFLRAKYFLTPAQEYIRNELLKCIDGTMEGAFFHIAGRPGTGKTLLLYDLAKSLSERGNTVMIHCGELTEGDLIISKAIDSLEIISADDITEDTDLSGFDFVAVDESHSLLESTFKHIVSTARANEQICIFSSDPEIALTNAEKDRNIAGQIEALEPEREFVLSERMRLNTELYTFIMTLKHLSYRSERKYTFFDVSVNYANNIDEARQEIEYYRNGGYMFINACRKKDDPFADLDDSAGCDRLIGQEYDKVVMLMDSSFSYDKDGFLKGIPQPDPENIYPNLFYQGITRVREKLALVILDAPELFSKIASIIDGSDHQSRTEHTPKGIK
ncbi:MAG: AAA family ATPase [Clostridiales bacterium]|nr:AAA family ATPase [Clostridiales bacterium]